ncbi:LysR family transcriptional regulator [Plastoroseomonas hellenica]|uniref:LysR family transcriptional regulator n=1 Tax=Plastoroseomonas hellenica TaxID=2687306 RepID=UPI00346284B7
MRLPKIRSLDALRAFVEGGSVSSAAARLGLTQPQAGRLLAGLEAELGFALFTRENRRLALTPEGWRFYGQAERVLAGHDGLARLAREIRQGRQDNHLRVLTAPQATHAVLGEALVTMARLVPGFTATIEGRARLDIEALVEQEHFDLGVTVPPLSHPRLKVEPLCETEAVLVLPKAHPLARRRQIGLMDLVGQDLIATHPRSLLRQRLQQLFRDIDQEPRIRFEALNGTIACQLVGLGLGIGLADPFVARSSGAAGMVMRRFEPTIPLPYGLFYPAWQKQSEIAVQLAGLIRDTAQHRAAAIMRSLRGPAASR